MLPIPPPFDTSQGLFSEGLDDWDLYDWENSLGQMWRSQVGNNGQFRFILIQNPNPNYAVRIHLRDETGEIIQVEFEDRTTGMEKKVWGHDICTPQREETTDNSGGDDTKTKWRNGDGTLSFVVPLEAWQRLNSIRAPMSFRWEDNSSI